MNAVLHLVMQCSINLPLRVDSGHPAQLFGPNPDTKMRLACPIIPGMADMKMAFINDLQPVGGQRFGKLLSNFFFHAHYIHMSKY